MEKKEFNQEELRKLGALIKSRLGTMRPWEKMFGTLCYNIWNHPSNKYLKTQRPEDLKWAIGSTLGVFTLWEELKISKVYDLNKIALEAPEQIIDALDSFIHVEGHWYQSFDEHSSLMSFATAYEKEYRNIAIKEVPSPKAYFQKGIEFLLFVVLRAKRFRPDVFENIKAQATQDPDIKSICMDLDTAF